MLEALEQLVKQVESDDTQEQDEAVLQIAMLLEKHSTIPDKPYFYNKILDPQLNSITLTSDDQKMIVRNLCLLLSSGQTRSGIVWAIGKTRRTIAFQPLLSLIKEQAHRFDEEIAWEAMCALDKFIAVSDEVVNLEEQASLINQYDVILWLQEMVLAGTSRLQRESEWILAKIREAEHLV